MFHYIFDKLLLGTDIAKLEDISVCLSLNTLPFEALNIPSLILWHKQNSSLWDFIIVHESQLQYFIISSLDFELLWNVLSSHLKTFNSEGDRLETKFPQSQYLGFFQFLW